MRRARAAAGLLVAGLMLVVLVPLDRPIAALPPPQPPPPLTAKGPVGWDLYRRLDLLPMLPRGVETRQFSSFDRTGANHDFSHCLRQAPDGCVIAEHSGPGEIDTMWFTRDFGDVGGTGAIKVELDGAVVVYAPLRDLVSGALGAPFIFPLVADYLHSSGGNTVAVPMPFRKSMRVVTDTDPVYYHLIYRVFGDDVGVRTFDPRDRALDVVRMLQAAGRADPKPARPGATTASGDVRVEPGGSAVLADFAGPGTIEALRLGVPQPAASGVRLQLAFDGERTVDAPLTQFFGSGLGGGRVTALMFAMDARSGSYAAWWPMPYRRRATVSIVNESRTTVAAVHAEVTTAPDGPRDDEGAFRADSHAAATIPGLDYSFLDVAGSGKLVGVNATLRGPRSLLYLEGNERIFVDGSRTPQVPGTGTEDFFGGGWYFDHGTFTNPVTGEPAQERGTPGCPANLDCRDAYRTLLLDAIPFASGISAGIEHGGVDDVQATYSSTTLWYGQDRATLRLEDTAVVAGAPLTSTFEGRDGRPVTVTMGVAATAAPVRLTLTVSPGNSGIVLRRTSDQRLGYQSATVVVNDRVVGTWLEPLGNPYRRWLDDTFLLPASVTAGQQRLDVTLIPTRGAPPWTAARYQALAVL